MPRRKMTPGASYCGVFGCWNNSKMKPHLSYFSVPQDVKRRQTWTKLMMREDLLHTVKKCKYYVCSEHFEDTMLKNKRLKLHAVPTLKLPEAKPPKPVVSSSPSSNDDAPDVHIKTEVAVDESSTIEDPLSEAKPPGPSAKRARIEVPSVSQSLVDIEDQVRSMAPQQDYYDDFGLYIASLLRLLSKKRAEAVQPKIMDIIACASQMVAKYSKRSKSKSLLSRIQQTL